MLFYLSIYFFVVEQTLVGIKHKHSRTAIKAVQRTPVIIEILPVSINATIVKKLTAQTIALMILRVKIKFLISFASMKEKKLMMLCFLMLAR